MSKPCFFIPIFAAFIFSCCFSCVAAITYSEDFSENPNYSVESYTPKSGEFFTWDTIDQIYKVRLIEEDDVPKYALSRTFGMISNVGFEVSFDFKHSEVSYGFPVGISLCNDTNYLVSRSYPYIIHTTFGDGDKVRFSDGTSNQYTKTEIPGEVWYTATLEYHHSSQTADFSLVVRDSGSVLYQTSPIASS